MKGYTNYALFKSRQLASGFLDAIKMNLTTKFYIIKEKKNADKSQDVTACVKNSIKDLQSM